MWKILETRNVCLFFNTLEHDRSRAPSSIHLPNVPDQQVFALGRSGSINHIIKAIMHAEGEFRKIFIKSDVSQPRKSENYLKLSELNFVPFFVSSLHCSRWKGWSVNHRSLRGSLVRIRKIYNNNTIKITKKWNFGFK